MVEIRPVTPGDAVAFNAAVDIVAREKRFLGRTEGPSLEQSEAFIRDNLGEGNPHLVAARRWRHRRLVRHRPRSTATRCSTIAARSAWACCQVAGAAAASARALLEQTIAAARAAAGMTRIELTVRCDNEAAIRLYERVGLSREGYHARHRPWIDGVAYDTLSMALIG